MTKHLILATAAIWIAACSPNEKVEKPVPAPSNIAVTMTARIGDSSSPAMAYAPTVYPVSTTESVTLEAGYLVITDLNFTGMEGCDGQTERDAECSSSAPMELNDVATMKTGFAAASGGHVHGDSGTTTTTRGTGSGEAMTRLQEADPFVIDLVGAPTELGTFGIPRGTYGRFELSTEPVTLATSPDEVVGFSLYLKGVYASPVTTIPFTVQLSCARKIIMMPMSMGAMGMAPKMMDAQAGMESIKLERDVLANLQFDSSLWFANVGFGTAATTSSLVVTDGSTISGVLLDRIAASGRLGLDANGNGIVEKEEYQISAMEGCMMMTCEDMVMEQ